MTDSERARNHLLARLREVLGDEEAATLMDLTHLSEKMDLRFEAQGDRIEALVRERIDSQTKLLFFSIIGALLTTAAIALGSAAL